MFMRRDGERRNITNLLEAVVYAESGMPGLANEFEINFGGMRFNVNINYKRGAQIVAQLFMEHKAILDLNCVFLRSEDDGTAVVKFESLSNKQRLILGRILRKL